MGAPKQPKAAPVAAPTPQYGSEYQQGTTTTGQQFDPWSRAQPTYDAMADQMNAQAAWGPQYVGPSEQTRKAWSLMESAIPGMQSAANTALNNYNSFSSQMGTLGGGGGGSGYVGVKASKDSEAWFKAIKEAMPGVQKVADTAFGNYGFLSKAADVSNNPYVQGMMANNRAAAQRSLTEDFLPALGNQSQAAGGMGGSRQGVAQGMATDRSMKSMLEANNNLAMGAYTQGLGAQVSALNNLGAMQAGMSRSADMYGDIGKYQDSLSLANQDASLRGAANANQAQANSIQAMNVQRQGLESLAALQQGLLAPATAYGAVGNAVEGYQQSAQDSPWRYLQNLGAAQQYLNPLGTLSGTSNARAYSASGPEGAYGPNGAVPPASAPTYYQQQYPSYQNPWLNGGSLQQYPYSAESGQNPWGFL